MKKRIFSIALIIFLFATFLQTTAFAASTIASGHCGGNTAATLIETRGSSYFNIYNNLTWTLDSNGVLTISGTGAMAHFSDAAPAPWLESYKSSITNVVVQSGVTSIGIGAFAGCTNLTSVTIPVGVTSIGLKTFESCTSLQSVSLPTGLTDIGEMAFFKCSSLASISIPSSVTNIGDNAFYECGLTSITIPSSATSIGLGAFHNCNFSSVTIPAGVTSIGQGAFYLCSNLAVAAFEGNAPSSFSTIVFDWCAEGFTIHAPENNATWTSGGAFNATAMTWNGYPIIFDAASQGGDPQPENPQPVISDFDKLFLTDSTTYNNEIALIAAKLSNGVYSSYGSDAKAILKEYGFEDSQIITRNYNPINTDDGILAYIIATKEYSGADADYITVIVAQGSTNPYELIKDATALASRTYTANGNSYPVYDIVDDFYTGIKNTFNPISGKKYKILLTGHSLGGAAANLAAASLIDRSALNSNRFDVFCYTFGAINSINSSQPVCDGYESIHNVYNLLDTFSPFQQGGLLPTGMGRGYGKFGQMESFGADYRSFPEMFILPLGQIALHRNHDMINYVEAVESGKVLNSKYRSDSFYSVSACPVDVSVYQNGELVGRTINNEVDESVTTIDLSVISDVKFIVYPDSKRYDLKFSAFDEGSMTFATVNAQGNGQVKMITDIVLEEGKQMMSTVGGEIDASDIALYLVGDDGNTPIAEITEDGTEVPILYTLSFSANGHGVAPASQTINAGDKAAEPIAPIAIGYTFGGWYKEDTCINKWDFASNVVSGNITLYAKWTTNSSDGGGGLGGTSRNSNKPLATDSDKPVSSIKFVDVPEDAYYYDAVLWAAENSITAGVDATHFAPFAVTTRGQMVTFLWRAAGCPEPTATTCNFADVDANAYYYKAVLWAAENGITGGTSVTTFSPDMNVSRAQTVTFLARMSGVKDDATGYTHSFTDVKAGNYFNNAVAWAYENNITSGTSEATFSPSDDCLRSQIVTFLYRNFVK